MLYSFVIFLTICRATTGNFDDEEWSESFFPRTSSNRLDNIEDDSTVKGVKVSFSSRSHDHGNRPPMGVRDENCDIGEDPLGLDGDLSEKSYTCFESNLNAFKPDPRVSTIFTPGNIPFGYEPGHSCMDTSIHYNTRIPTFGDHRPLWAKYGEYTYLPKQRWLHNLEHGSIVFLYHPCADKNEINLIRRILKDCMYQYVITAFHDFDLSSRRILALVSWGASLEMSKVFPEAVTYFIRKQAFKAPEKTSHDGQYDKNLLQAASTELKDKPACWKYDQF